MAWGGDEAGEGTDVDDATLVLFSHDGQDGVDHSGAAEEIGFKDRFGLFEGDFFGEAVDDEPGVVDEDVDSACDGEDFFDAGVDGVVGGYVEGQQAWELAAGGSEYAVEFLGEQGGGFPAKAGGCAGDQDDFLFGHFLLPLKLIVDSRPSGKRKIKRKRNSNVEGRK